MRVLINRFLKVVTGDSEAKSRFEVLYKLQYIITGIAVVSVEL